MRRTHTTSVFLQSPLRTVDSVLADIERFGDWLPGVDHVRLLAREDRTAVLELGARRWGQGRYLFEVTVEPEAGLRFRQVGRLRQRGVSGSVTVEEADGGVLVQAEVSAMTAGIFDRGREAARALAEATHALDLRVQKAVLGSLPPVSGRERTVLEVRTGADGYELRFQDKTWRLVEAQPSHPDDQNTAES